MGLRFQHKNKHKGNAIHDALESLNEHEKEFFAKHPHHLLTGLHKVNHKLFHGGLFRKLKHNQD